MEIDLHPTVCWEYMSPETEISRELCEYGLYLIFLKYHVSEKDGTALIGSIKEYLNNGLNDVHEHMKR